jgi:hypothetical protein
MMKPNWFDQKYDAQFAAPADAHRILSEIAKDSRVVDAVKAALADHDSHPGRPGGSRTQAVRSAIAEVLQEA